MKLVTYLEKFDLLDCVEAAAGDEFYDVKQWKFALNHRANGRFGCCKYTKRLVEVTSEYFAGGKVKEEEYDNFINTLKHETAHVIVRERYGKYRNGCKVQPHGREWKMVMYSLGVVNIKRSGKSKVLKEVRKKAVKHTYTCKDCGFVYERQRKIKSLVGKYHGGCKRKPNGGTLIHTQLR